MSPVSTTVTQMPHVPHSLDWTSNARATTTGTPMETAHTALVSVEAFSTKKDTIYGGKKVLMWCDFSFPFFLSFSFTLFLFRLHSDCLFCRRVKEAAPVFLFWWSSYISSSYSWLSTWLLQEWSDLYQDKRKELLQVSQFCSLKNKNRKLRNVSAACVFLISNTNTRKVLTSKCT